MTDMEIERECVWYGLVWSKSNKFTEKRKTKRKKKKIYEYFLYRIAVKLKGIAPNSDSRLNAKV